MKLVVMIPCLNEERTLPQTLADIPRRIPGVDEVEILVIDDGSNDDTINVAKRHGADHIIRHKRNCGLARSFRNGIDAALRLGADIIVNTDGDNQYRGEDIAALVEPILEERYDVVIGDRQTGKVSHFSPSKKILQTMGSSVVRLLSGLQIPDAVSGFRAFSRNAALQLNVVSPFSYTIETLIQAGMKRMAVGSVPVRTNAKTRESRLFKSIPKFVLQSVMTMVRMYAMYQPLRVFLLMGVLVSLIGALPLMRFLYFFAMGDAGGHIQSLVIGGALLVIGIVVSILGLLGDLLNFNRQLLEILLEKERRRELAAQDMAIPNAEWVWIGRRRPDSGKVRRALQLAGSPRALAAGS